jgi:hypothetical protein
MTRVRHSDEASVPPGFSRAGHYSDRQRVSSVTSMQS